MARYGVVAVGGNRTHLEGYARSFVADPRCELIAVADEPGLPEYREGLNRLLANELGVPYLLLEQAPARDDVQIVPMSNGADGSPVCVPQQASTYTLISPSQELLRTLRRLPMRLTPRVW